MRKVRSVLDGYYGERMSDDEVRGLVCKAFFELDVDAEERSIMRKVAEYRTMPEDQLVQLYWGMHRELEFQCKRGVLISDYLIREMEAIRRLVEIEPKEVSWWKKLLGIFG